MNIKVVIVDDEADFVKIFKELLEMRGINVVGTAYNGKDAVKLYKQKKPDILFLDVRMPYYDGYYATKEIFSLDKNAKIILLTGSPTVEITAMLKELPIAAIVCKPIDIEKIVFLIEKVLLS
ncbi:MAG: response regulator [Thaumarchaeota archaeon]|nr:response regulator [Nitrososphaerota archaeon]